MASLRPVALVFFQGRLHWVEEMVRSRTPQFYLGTSGKEHGNYYSIVGIYRDYIRVDRVLGFIGVL